MTLSEIARRLNLRGPEFNNNGKVLPTLILMTDEQRLADPVPVVRQLPPGAAVLFRHYGASGREAIALTLKQICRERRLQLIISADVDLATRLNADGLHLPEYLLNSPNALHRVWRLRCSGILSAAAHSPRALQRAQQLGVDAAIVSPVFPTRSHPDRPAIGATRFLSWCHAASLPVYALGGVTSENAGRLNGPNIQGIAGIGGFL